MDQERTFLHDIASPLTSIQLNMENAVCMLEDGGPESIADCLKLLQACLAQAERASAMVRARREVLIEGKK